MTKGDLGEIEGPFCVLEPKGQKGTWGDIEGPFCVLEPKGLLTLGLQYTKRSLNVPQVPFCHLGSNTQKGPSMSHQVPFRVRVRVTTHSIVSAVIAHEPLHIETWDKCVRVAKSFPSPMVCDTRLSLPKRLICTLNTHPSVKHRNMFY